ncbi:hypothetical protein LINGRAHAP2_LOCUS33431 [Linum grandiflorum]
MYTTLAAAGHKNMFTDKCSPSVALHHVASGSSDGRRRINNNYQVLPAYRDTTNHRRHQIISFLTNYRLHSGWHASSTTSNKSKNLVVVHSNVGPGPTASDPSTPPGSNWRGWLVGVLMSFLLPLWRNQLWSLKKLEDKVEAVVETIEEVVETVEEVAEKVEEVAEEMGKSMPEGKLKHMLEDIEEAADKAEKAAELAHQVLDKVQAAEDQVESLIDGATVKKEQKKPNGSTAKV